MNLTGRILVISDTKPINETLQKREFVIEFDEKKDGRYPQPIKFEAIQEKCDLLDFYKVGDDVSVDYNLKGRSWTNPKNEDIYFNSMQMWRISMANAVAAPGMQNPALAPVPAPYAPAPGANFQHQHGVPAPAPVPLAPVVMPGPVQYQQANPAPIAQLAPVAMHAVPAPAPAPDLGDIPF